MVCGLLGAGALAGCDRGKNAPAPVSSTVVHETPPQQALGPASRPTMSLLYIQSNDPRKGPVTTETKFPPARMVVIQRDPVCLRLYSDDPRGALLANYAGNRYFLEFQLTIDDLAQLSTADYSERAPSMQRADRPFGIFLNGDSRQLQPYNIQVSFQTQGPDVMVNILPGSQFLMFDTRDDSAAPKLVQVSGSLLAELEDPGRENKTAEAP